MLVYYNANAKNLDIALSESADPNYGTESYFRELFPGFVYTPKSYFTAGKTIPSGNYFVKDDVEVTATKKGQSGLIINGDVNIYLVKGEDGHLPNFKVTGGDSEGSTGAGAGIELNEGNFLHFAGVGNVICQGGSCYATTQQNGGNGGKGYGDDDPCPDETVGGRGGAGGSGSGGAAAAIGSKGATGGKGGDKTKEDRQNAYIFPDQPYKGHAGNNGSKGDSSKNAGLLFTSGAVSINCNGGVISTEKLQDYHSGSYGTYSRFIYNHTGTFFSPDIPYRVYGGGGGGTGGIG